MSEYIIETKCNSNVLYLFIYFSQNNLAKYVTFCV